MPAKKQGARGRPRTTAHTTRVGEVRLVYDVAAVDDDEDEGDDPVVWATTRLSTKNQITLPVRMVRALGLKPGDELDLFRIGDEVILDRRPQTAKEWVAKTRGSLAHLPEWQTKEGIDAYIRRERDSWDREWDPDESS